MRHMKINRDIWAFLFFCMPAYKIFLIQQNSFTDIIFDYWAAVSFGILLLKMSTKKHIFREIIMLFAFCGLYIIVTLFNFNNQVLGAMSECCRILIVPIFLYLLYDMNEKQYLRNVGYIRKTFLLILTIDFLVTFYSVLFKPLFVGGEMSIMGYANYATFMIMPMCVVVLYASTVVNGRIHFLDIAVLILEMISKIVVHSTTAVIAFAIFLLIFLCSRYYQKILKILSPKFFFCVLALFMIGIVFFQIQNLFLPIFTMLGKDPTLSYRTVIWNKTVNAIIQNPLFGYGKLSGDQYKTIVGFSLIWDTQASHPHNLILDIVMSTGITGLTIYITYMFKCIRRIKSVDLNKGRNLLAIGLICYFILGFADGYYTVPTIYIVCTIIGIEYKRSMKRRAER
ncbi:O-antigen ligase family protein [Blautia schinkii]|nr:O-antigen ligase family protein [Blautia schinkii]